MAWTTSKSLLRKIKLGDEIGWYEFENTYRPFIISRGKRAGLSEDECQDLVQDALLAIFKNSETFEYNQEIGRFRGYLSGIIRNKIIDIYRKRPNAVPLLEQDLAMLDESMEEGFMDEWREHLRDQAYEELKGQVELSTYEAYQLYVVQERPVKDVAVYLDMSESSVYVAKTRCKEKLKTIIAEINASDPEANLRNE